MFGRKRRKQRDAELARARQWQQDAWEWSQLNPGQPVMEAEITAETTTVTWNGPEL